MTHASQRTALENRYVTIQYIGRFQRGLDIVWRDFTPSREFRPILTALVDVLRSHRRPSYWLWDHSAAKIIAPEDQAWLLGGWFQCLEEIRVSSSARRVAVVQAVDLFGRLSVNHLARRLTERCARIAVRVFEERVGAVAWLNSRLEEGRAI